MISGKISLKRLFLFNCPPMQKILLYFFLFFSGFNLSAQDFFIKECKLKLTLPDKEWKLGDKKEGKASVLYKFKRTTLKDSSDKKITPEIVVISENIKSYTDLKTYSIAKQKPYANLKNYKVEKVFTESDGMLKLTYAIGHKASYTDADSIKHVFYFIHAVRDGKGVQVIMDVPADFFEVMEEDFTAVIRSLEYIK
jgi:hypothetical protein